MWSLYWIRYNSHTDINTEGYVGITTDVNNRWKEHHTNKNNPIVVSAIKRGATIEVIKEDLTKEEVCVIENKLRPHENIGWNLAPGGNVPPVQKGKSRKNNKQSLVGENRTESQRLASERHSVIMSKKPSPHKGKVGHSKGCGTKPCYYKGKMFKSRTEAAEHFGVTVGAVTLYCKRHKEKQPGGV